MATGIILGVFGLAAFFALVLRLATYAVPAFAAMAAGSWTYCSGAGVFGSVAVGIFVGAITLSSGRAAFGTTSSKILQAIIVMLFAVPAAFAGYHIVLALAQLGDCPKFWGQIFAVASAAITGIAATSRLIRTV
jgi:hypothetical protein